MLSLIKFELKKMLTRRVAVAANAGAIVMLVAVMALNVMQARAEGNIGEILSGPEAIARRREVAEARAGDLTPERVAADIARYQEIAYERLNPEELAEMSDAAAYEAVAEAYDEATRLELYDPYYITLLKPWAVRGLEPYQYAFRVTPEMALDFYGALAASLQDSLDEGMGGEWVYSPAERVFWTEKEAGVAEPIGYGWSGGWDNILDCTAFLVFAIFAACVTVTPLFAFEYREGTDAVLLSSLNGRGRLVAAKLAAAALHARHHRDRRGRPVRDRPPPVGRRRGAAPHPHAVPHGAAVAVRHVRRAVLLPGGPGRARPYRHGGPRLRRPRRGRRPPRPGPLVSAPGRLIGTAAPKRGLPCGLITNQSRRLPAPIAWYTPSRRNRCDCRICVASVFAFTRNCPECVFSRGFEVNRTSRHQEARGSIPLVSTMRFKASGKPEAFYIYACDATFSTGSWRNG